MHFAYLYVLKCPVIVLDQFARFLSKFAKAARTELDELIDFMVVQSALKDNDEAEEAYVKTLGEKAQAQLMRRGGRRSSKWFGMG